MDATLHVGLGSDKVDAFARFRLILIFVGSLGVFISNLDFFDDNWCLLYRLRIK